MTLYYNQHLDMMKPLLAQSGKPLVVPPRSQRKKREAMLDKYRLFDCPNCRRIVRYDFGADVGHKDILKYGGHGDKRQLDLLKDLPEAQRVIKLDAYMRRCCDDCWAAIDRGSEPRKGWDRGVK